jgi:hypothetical protein
MSDDPVTSRRRTGHTPAGSLNPLRAEEGEQSGSIQLQEKPLPSPPIEDHLPHGASLALLILALGLSFVLGFSPEPNTQPRSVCVLGCTGM